MAVLVDLQGVSAASADRALFEDLDLTVSEGERVGIVGINGTGKSTLLRVLAGIEVPTSGTVARARGQRVGYLAQEPALNAGTVADAVGPGWEAEAVLERLGMGALAGRDVAALSGGQAKRVALAAVLCRESELLVLDEPTNHLDLASIDWLERRLLERRGGLVLVSHDRHLLDRLTTRMVELDRGRAHAHQGGYASYLEARARREEQAATAESVRRNLARRELVWLRRGAPARSTKPKARLEAARQTVSARAAAPARAGELQLDAGTRRLGDLVLECRGVAFSHGAVPVLTGLDLALDPRERLGLVGANGSGKSTLLDLLAGRLVPDVGEVVRGSTVEIGYYDQLGAELDETVRVRDVVAGPAKAPGSPEDNALMERFWFGGELAFARVATLSGGERRRLQLLLVLARRPNVLLMDEPTNDFDLDTLRVLEDYLEDWPGALVVASHDRTFLDRTTERLVALGPSTTPSPVAGGLAAWLASATATPARPASGRPEPVRVASGRVRDAPGEARRSPSTLGRLLREADKDLAAAVRRRDALLATLAAERDHRELARLGGELAGAESTLAEVEKRWLNLAEEAEDRD